MRKLAPQAIFKTERIPATQIHQNHLDLIYELLNRYCATDPHFSLSLDVKLSKKEAADFEQYILKRKPRTLMFIVSSDDKSQELTVLIDNGITVNLKNGTFSLYGLYMSILDNLSSLKVPHLLATMRRYWLFNSFFAGLFIPAIVLFLLNSSYWAAWLIGFPFGLFLLIGAALNASEGESTWLDDLEWEDIVLSTKIKYGTYSNTLGSPMIVFLTSTKTLISLITSIATIVSFIFFFINK